MSHRTVPSALVLALALAATAALSRPARAEEGAPAAPVAGPAHAHVGLHAGVLLPQISSELSTAIGINLQAGYRVWRNLSPFLAVGYAQPPVDHAGTDPRLTPDGGSFSTSTTQRELTATMGALWRLRPQGARLNAFGGLGVRAYFLETITNGEAGGASFLENRETSTRWGALGLAGGELRLGPGAAAAAVEVGGSDLPHLITGDVATTAIGVTLGYVMFF